MKEKLFIVTWRDNQGEICLKTHKYSAEDALQEAFNLGYRPPKWWQFWLSAAEVEEIN